MRKSRLQPAVVLVADRTLSADYRILFEGIFATMQTSKVPDPIMRRFVAPPVSTDADDRARVAPLGLRRIEAALLAHTPLSEDDVVVTTPERLGELLGPWTRVVGVSSADPLGNGMSNTTTTSFWGGELYSRRWMRRMLEQITQAKREYGFVVIGGGGGAWQWRQYEDPTARECLDVIFEGYFEDTGPELVTQILSGRPAPDHIIGKSTAVENARPIRAASLLGTVELSRGCGRGCRFCSMATRKMAHLPVDMICADLETNAAAGITSVVSGSEDLFRYGAEGVTPNVDRLIGLFTEMRRIKGLGFLQIDHANISSVAQLTLEELRQVRRLMTWDKPTDYLWVNMGLESANGHLVAASGRGKIAPFRPDDWEDMARQVAEKMTQAGFFSVFSLVLGLPGETGADVTRTLRLVQDLKKYRMVVFPVFYEPILETEIREGAAFRVETMRADHLELYRTCYEINFQRVPAMFWDNQRAGGVSWTRRALMRALGLTEVAAWRRKFAQVGRAIRARDAAVPLRRVPHAG